MKYVLSRLAQAVVVVWAAFTVSFVILFLLPGDPTDIMVGTDTNIDPAEVEKLRAQYGLDKGPVEQYVHQLGNVLRGDLGTSIQNGKPVAASIGDALPETVKLTAFALLLSIIGAVALATAATLTRSVRLRGLLLALPPLGVAVPTFWVGLVLLQVFAFRLGWFPSLGNAGLDSLVLPAVTLAIPTSAALAQVLSSSLLETSRKPFVEIARAKGITESRLVTRHVLRNGTVPALTLLGITVGGLLAGSVVTETVYSRVGIGRLAQTAVTAQDIPLVQGVVLLAAAIFALVNLFADLVYPLVDPRIRVRGRGASAGRSQP